VTGPSDDVEGRAHRGARFLVLVASLLAALGAVVLLAAVLVP
jgi:hypothetical protein